MCYASNEQINNPINLHVLHNESENPSGHMHVKPSNLSKHSPPFWQGLLAHSFSSVIEKGEENHITN